MSAFGASFGAAFGDSFGAGDAPPVAVVNQGGGGSRISLRSKTARKKLRLPVNELFDREKLRHEIESPAPAEIQPVLIEQATKITDDGLIADQIFQMTQSEVINEIRRLMAVQFRNDEEEALMFVFMEAV